MVLLDHVAGIQWMQKGAWSQVMKSEAGAVTGKLGDLVRQRASTQALDAQEIVKKTGREVSMVDRCKTLFSALPRSAFMWWTVGLKGLSIHCTGLCRN